MAPLSYMLLLETLKRKQFSLQRDFMEEELPFFWRNNSEELDTDTEPPRQPVPSRLELARQAVGHLSPEQTVVGLYCHDTCIRTRAFKLAHKGNRILTLHRPVQESEDTWSFCITYLTADMNAIAEDNWRELRRTGWPGFVKHQYTSTAPSAAAAV